jgi:hypothetical protein
MGLIEIHPRTYTRSVGNAPSAERRFVDTPDVTVREALPVIGSAHPDHFDLKCVSILSSTHHEGDPQQTLFTVRYEASFP